MTIAVTVLLTLGFSASLFGQQPLASTKEILKEQQAAIAAVDQKAVDSLIALATKAIKSDAADGLAVATEAWETVLSIDPENKPALNYFKMIGRPAPEKIERKKWSQGDATYTRLPNGKWAEEFDDKKYIFDETYRDPDVIVLSNGSHTQRLHPNARYYSKNGSNQWIFRPGKWVQ